jgi:alkanesulfonate monooxygenase SsuD/methylene tetrahydromethanopterin reductase-like flavin-dependent oxidoreductase (luciferase family)
MKIGISVSSSYPDIAPNLAVDRMVERTREANWAGLDHLFVGDHHSTKTPYFQNNVILGRMLAEWGDKPFGALYLLPLWNPVLLAEQVGTLAAVGKGRFIMQCGLGDPRQGAALGVDMRRQVGLFVAALKVMQALCRGETVDEVTYWQLQRARISPVPSEPVEVWIGALVAPAITRAATLGDGWLAAPSLTLAESAAAIQQYKTACANAEKAMGAAAIRRDILISETSQAAKRAVAPYLAAGYRGIPPEALLVGSVDEVTDCLGQLNQQGYTEIIVRNISGDQGQCLKTIALLSEVKAALQS